MRELFDARLNLDDKPMTQAQLAEALSSRRRAGADGDRPDRRRRAEGGRRAAQADRQFRQRRRQHRRGRRGPARHHRHQHAGRADRGHRRHDHGADPRGAAPARRGRDRPHRRQATGAAGRRPGCSATASGASGSASSAWADRPGGGAARPRLRPADPLSQPPPRPAEDRGGAAGDLLGQPRPDAGAHGHHLGQLPAHARDLPPAVGAPAEAAAARRPMWSTPRAAR